MHEPILPFYLVVVPLLGILAQWIAWRFKIPSILLLLVLGILLGFWKSPDELIAQVADTSPEVAPSILFPIVSLAVAVILFEGGLTLRFKTLADRGTIVLRLVLVASVAAWILIAVAARTILAVGWELAALLGAILIVTGPTVVGPLLRQIRPNRSVSTVLQWEGILIDPLGAVAAVLTFEFIAHPDLHWLEAATNVVWTMLAGTAIGLASAGFLVWMLRRYWIPDFLHGAFFLVVTLAAFWSSNMAAEEAGLVAVTLLGIGLANQKWVDVEHVLEFKEHLRVLLISTLFIVLGSRLRLDALQSIGWSAVPFVLALVLVVRPVSVWLATIGCGWNWRERLFVGLVAPRGIVAASVASVFGLKLVQIAAEQGDAPIFGQAELLAPITFCVILGTVLLCGLGAAPLARGLGLADVNPQGILFAGAGYPIREIAVRLRELGLRIVLIDRNYSNVVAARMTGLEAYCMNVLSEHVLEEFDLAGIGYFIAATPSDETNTLASLEYLHLFDRQRVYQLAPRAAEQSRWGDIPAARKARLLGNGELTYERLEQTFESGALVKLIRITDTFTPEDFRAQYGDQALVLFWKSASGTLKISAVDEKATLSPGDQVIAIVPATTEVPAGGAESAGGAPVAE